MADKLPIIIFKGDESLCYGVLRSYSEQLRDALIELGEDVIYLDPATAVFGDYKGKRFKAVIAFMENFFYTVHPETGELIFDLIEGPKFNYWTDYPGFYYKQMERVPKDFYILTLDRNYVNFINKYYRNTRAFFLPPGGRKADRIIPFSERKYGLSFVGSFLNWEDAIRNFDSADATTKVIVDRYLDYLINEPDTTTEEGFRRVLDEFGARVDDGQFLKELGKVHPLADRGVSRLFRQEIINTILDSGIELDVFGDSWRNAPFSDKANLHIHPYVDSGSVNEIYENSRMSLNIMTWHKDSITERVLDSMMAGAIAVSDQTMALRESFVEGKEILLYSLAGVDRLPNIIKANLDNEKLAQRGQEKAMEDHTWKDRARQLLDIIKNIKYS
ncbi:glycosyltransferase [Butyrivibrio proteoclasticus]|uniref:glycosyltransferase family protein n=1 Tax=Butyrivibrio proteoclasticus TaxID=43305 RepID=UPI00047B3A99|nr:glycosyltransferase [Butyrivibrio proteoclasticus]